MHETFRHEDGPDAATRILVACGELDARRAEVVARRIEQSLGDGKRRLILDLSEVTYVETGGLNALLDANARLRRFGVALAVVIPPDSRVRALFRVTRLDKVLRICETRDAALEPA